MNLEYRAPESAVGHVLCHNLTDASGRKALGKGRVLRQEDIGVLRELAGERVLVAVLAPDDVAEQTAAGQLAAALTGPGIRATTPAAGRVNLLAEQAGVVHIDPAGLLAVNEHDGLTVATVTHLSTARPRSRIATVKVIPYAVPAALLHHACATARQAAPIIRLHPFVIGRVGVILTGSSASQQRLREQVAPAIEQRVQDVAAQVVEQRVVDASANAIAEAIRAQVQGGAELLIIAGETSVMDSEDVTPQAVRQEGGRVAHYGAPVEPGNLLMLGYLPAPERPVPVIGAPGCVRSRDTNIVDLVLPRLVSGEVLERRDILALGHGGLLGK